MIRFVDNIINSITMYRLVLYVLIVMAVYSVILGLSDLLFYTGVQLISSLALIIAVCFVSNWLFSKVFRAPVNVESWAITALILFFLFMPFSTQGDAITLVLASVIAMASKYFLAIKRIHIFNPAAFAAVALSLNPNTIAFWWVGTPLMLPVVLIGGLIVVRKIRRFTMVSVFIVASVVGTYIFGALNNVLSLDLFFEMIMSGPLVFFATIMLTEPLTSPHTRKLQMSYAAIVGLLYPMQFNIGPLYSSPEMALIIGNIFTYIVSSKQKLFLNLKVKREIAAETYEFVFSGTNGSMASDFNHTPGQYLEWTVPHTRPDSRGARRYFTVASSPTGEDILLGVKIGKNPSSFKRHLVSLDKNGIAIAAQLGGDFVLPEDKAKKLVFIAGGIGVTPFRSMVKYLLDKKEKRDVILIYFNKTADEIAYRDIFEQAERELGLRSIYVLTDKEHVPTGWKGESGRLDEKTLEKIVPDYRERIFYISGPNALVNNYKHILYKTGVKKHNVRTDYFPGF